MNPLLQLIEHGQSYWLDNLDRRMLADGELRHRVDYEGLRGLTSNPATFQKPIVAGSGSFVALPTTVNLAPLTRPEAVRCRVSLA